MLPCHHATTPPRYHTIMLPRNHATTQPRYHTTMLPCNHATMHLPASAYLITFAPAYPPHLSWKIASAPPRSLPADQTERRDAPHRRAVTDRDLDLTRLLHAPRPDRRPTVASRISLFNVAQALPQCQLAPSASVARSTRSTNAQHQSSGQEIPHDAHETTRDVSSTRTELSSVATSRRPQAVHLPTGPTSTNVQDADRDRTELRIALSRRRLEPLTPLRASAWRRLLKSSGLVSRYPNLVSSILRGFDAGIKRIPITYTPPNGPSISTYHTHFTETVHIEFASGRYLGPFSRQEVEEAIGPFQSSPIHLVEKPGKPGHFRLVQNLSHPREGFTIIASINSSICSDLFPCTWGTFNIICLLIIHLPPGSQGACRDVAKAYRTIALAPDQWPGTIVRLSECDEFTIDTSNLFGLTSGAGKIITPPYQLARS
jgi:hypothetical protein